MSGRIRESTAQCRQRHQPRPACRPVCAAWRYARRGPWESHAHAPMKQGGMYCHRVPLLHRRPGPERAPAPARRPWSQERRLDRHVTTHIRTRPRTRARCSSRPRGLAMESRVPQPDSSGTCVGCTFSGRDCSNLYPEPSSAHSISTGFPRSAPPSQIPCQFTSLRITQTHLRDDAAAQDALFPRRGDAGMRRYGPFDPPAC